MYNMLKTKAFIVSYICPEISIFNKFKHVRLGALVTKFGLDCA